MSKKRGGNALIFDTSLLGSNSRLKQNVDIKCQSKPRFASDLYFVGIGGAGMGSVARLLKNRGYAVSGSDTLSNLTTAALENMGVKINFQQDGKSICRKTGLIVASAAIPDSNLDIIKAKRLGIKIIKFSQLLGLLMRDKKGIAVSGTHGKTTTTAMISTILRAAGLAPACVIGGDTPEFNENSCPGDGDLFVTEACEYDRTFLNLTPQISVITNIDEDHLDYYKDINGLHAAFGEFASSVPSNGLLVTREHDLKILNNLACIKCNVESYAVMDGRNQYIDYSKDNLSLDNGDEQTTVCSRPASTNNLTWSATTPVFKDGKSHFSVFHKGRFFGDYCILLPGIHNVLNTLASIAICNHVGVSKGLIAEALSSFKGVNRRFQIIGTANDITIIDDYAHHPTAIETTLKAARDRYPGKRIWCLFQPHQYSRTKLLLERFVNSFGNADKIILAEIYTARDSLEDRKSVGSVDIVNKIKGRGSDAELITDHQEIIDVLCERLLPNDVLIVMGAGDIWKVGASVLQRLRVKEIGKLKVVGG